MDFKEGIILKFKLVWERFQEMTAEKKRRLALACTAVFSALLIVFVVISIPSARDRGKTENPIIYAPVPSDELFLPGEPDFLPQVILERERRSSWTEEDAGVYWQDPLKYGEEQWRGKIEAAIDDFLERVP